MHPEQPENPQTARGKSADSSTSDEAAGGDPDPPAHTAAARPSDGAVGRALALVRYLREGCPWDARQTPDSLRPYLLEEAHETADAVLTGDDEALAGELGDLLLNVAFQIVLAEERGAFDAPEVIRRLESKMARRHPHVYADAEEAPDWEELKARERAEDAGRDRPGPDGTGGVPDPFAGLPSALEPLGRALRAQQRAAALGFDWPGVEGALGKLREETREVEEVVTGPGPRAPDEGARDGDPRAGPRPDAPGAGPSAGSGGTVPHPDLEEELGDLFFAAVNVARLASVHPARAVESATRKFEDRFRELARRARARGLDLEGATLEEMESIWREVKADGG